MLIAFYQTLRELAIHVIVLVYIFLIKIILQIVNLVIIVVLHVMVPTRIIVYRAMMDNLKMLITFVNSVTINVLNVLL